MDELRALVGNIKTEAGKKDWYATGASIEEAQTAARTYAKTLPEDARKDFVQPFIDMWIHNSKRNWEAIAADLEKIDKMLGVESKAPIGARRPRRKTRGKSKKRRFTRRR